MATEVLKCGEHGFLMYDREKRMLTDAQFSVRVGLTVPLWMGVHARVVGKTTWIKRQPEGENGINFTIIEEPKPPIQEDDREAREKAKQELLKQMKDGLSDKASIDFMSLGLESTLEEDD